MTTFADLGIPFPLFEAPTGEASDYRGMANCRCCGGQDRHCFKLGIGDAMILPCPSCGTENGLGVDDGADVMCRSCGITIAFPESMKDKEHSLICYGCLRAGKAAMTKDTEFGMVSWDQAFKGVTHGAQGCGRTNSRWCRSTPTRTGMASESRASTSGSCSGHPAFVPGKMSPGCFVADDL